MDSPDDAEYPVTVHFHGQVLPRLTSISIHRTRQLRWNLQDVRMRLFVNIQNSQIHVEIRANKFVETKFLLFRNCAYDVARTAVELVAFQNGWGLSVELTKFIGPSGATRDLGVLMHPKLAPLCTSFDLTDASFEEVWGIVQSDKELFAIMNDLIDSIATPHVSVINCARVIDGLRNLISPKKNDWPAMHRALRVDAPYLMFISEHSKGPRHGNRGFVEGPTVETILMRSWTVMNRFLEYRKRKNTDLPESEFPMLTG